VTAAQGAKRFYSLQQAEGVGARSETVEEAIVQDEKTRRCWVGHPHFFIIDNSTDFKGKTQRAVDRILNLVGKAVPGHTLRKFRVSHTSEASLVQALQSSGVDTFRVFRSEQVFLSSRKRLRMRCQQDGHQASYYIQEELESGTVVERQISGRSYIALRSAAREQGIPVFEKQLVIFEWGGHLLEVNIFSDPQPVCIVEVEAESDSQPIDLPAFLHGADRDGVQEVTEDPAFDSYVISERLRGGSACAAAAEQATAARQERAAARLASTDAQF